MISSVISIVAAVIVFTGIGYYFLKHQAVQSGGKKRKFDPQQIDRSGSGDSSDKSGGVNKDLVKTKWAEIAAMQNSGASGLKNALFEADKLLDYVMIQQGFSGETMGDRLKSGGGAFTNLNAVWGAHKLRNQLAHEVEHGLCAPAIPEREGKHAVEARKAIHAPFLEAVNDHFGIALGLKAVASAYELGT